MAAYPKNDDQMNPETLKNREIERKRIEVLAHDNRTVDRDYEFVALPCRNVFKNSAQVGGLDIRCIQIDHENLEGRREKREGGPGKK